MSQLTPCLCTQVDIPLLLSDYKRMVKLTAEVKTFLEEQVLCC